MATELQEKYEKHKDWQLYLRALVPSAASLLGSLLLIIVIVGFHMVMLSRDPTLFLPHLTGMSGQDLADLYDNRVVQPIDQAFSSHLLGVLSTALVWGALGWGIYAVFDFLWSTRKALQEGDQEINMPYRTQVVSHPLHKQILTKVIIRFAVGMLAIIITVGMLPLMSNLFARDIAFLQAPNAAEMAKQGVIILVGWLAILHVYVVLGRWFVFRTRVFGEIIY